MHLSRWNTVSLLMQLRQQKPQMPLLKADLDAPDFQNQLQGVASYSYNVYRLLSSKSRTSDVVTWLMSSAHTRMWRIADVASMQVMVRQMMASTTFFRLRGRLGLIHQCPSLAVVRTSSQQFMSQIWQPMLQQYALSRQCSITCWLWTMHS